MKIIWTEGEIAFIKKHDKVYPTVAEKAMKRSNINFDDIEHINNHYENHRWGSDADRKYRKSAINKAIAKVAANAKDFL